MSVVSYSVRTIVAAVALAMMVSAPVSAGPIAEFNDALNAAYADYRMALAFTNQNNADGTMKAISGFELKWATLSATYAKAPPPQFAEDPKFAAVMALVADINKRAKGIAADGKLAESHDVLEQIREELGQMRLRNGLMNFSDRMNAFHAQMESVVAKSYGDLSPAGLVELREDAAVLVFLSEELRRNPPAGATSLEYAPLLQTLVDTVHALRDGARAGDRDATKSAHGRLKPAYSRLFVKFG